MATVFFRDCMIGIHNVREWDALIHCAELDDADLWVSGNTIYYMAQDLVKRPRADVKWLDIGDGAMTLDGFHAKCNKNVEVVRLLVRALHKN